jgi:glycosyltransferase involved in cell wall biosynthesis
VRVAFTLEQCWHRVPGGTAVAALELARALADRRDVELVGVAARHRHAPPEQWRPPIPVSQLALPRIPLYESWHYLRRPRVERATGRIDAIHATGMVMPPPSSPVVLTVHDLSYLDYPELFSRQGLRFFNRALDLARRDAALVLCSSLATLARCREAGFAEARLRHVPLGVRVTRATQEDVARVRQAYGLGERFILWTGTIEPRKNLPGLIRAFSLLDTDAELVLVGPRGWNETLDKRVGDLPASVRERVRLLGWVPQADLDALYAAATVMCFPSLLEGFGFPVVEAMGQGTPVVTSLGTSTEELAAGGAGLLVDPRRPDAIAEALGRILDDTRLAAQLTGTGLRRAAEYTWERTAALVASAYVEASGASLSS